MAEVNRMPRDSAVVRIRFRSPAFRDTAVRIIAVSVRMHARFCSLDVSRVVVIVRGRRVVTGLFELDEFRTHLRTRHWLVRLGKRSDGHCEDRRDNDC